MRLLAMALAVVLGGTTVSVIAANVEVGKAPPNFTLPSKSGKNIRLSELKGQVVLVNFWASWCGPCAEELPKLQNLQTQYQKAGFTLAAVNIDTTKADGDKALQKLKLNLDTLYDVNRSAARDFDIRTMPFTVIIDRNGIARYVHNGYASGVEKKYEQEIRELLKK